MKDLFNDLKEKGFSVSLGTKENAEYWSLLEKNFDPITLFSNRSGNKRSYLFLNKKEVLEVISNMIKKIEEFEIEESNKFFFLQKETERAETLKTTKDLEVFIKGEKNAIYTWHDMIIELLEVMVGRELFFKTVKIKIIDGMIIVKLSKKKEKKYKNIFNWFFRERKKTEYKCELEKIRKHFFSEENIKNAKRTKERINYFLEIANKEKEKNNSYFNKDAESFFNSKLILLDNFIEKKDFLLTKVLTKNQRITIKDITKKEIVFLIKETEDDILKCTESFESLITTGLSYSSIHPVAKEIFFNIGRELEAKNFVNNCVDEEYYKELIKKINEKY